MINLKVMTLFPEMIDQGMSHSIMKRAKEQGHLQVEAVNIRDFANNKHNQVDDYPYGGGAGMLMMAPPVYDCYRHITKDMTSKPRVIYMTPQGKVWNQKMAIEFSKEENIILLCGHYEGIDQRVIDEIVTDEVSIGDYVLTGGELAALVVADSIVRLIPGVLGKQASFEDESFSDGLLEYPQYTRPAEFNGIEVPSVLLSGNHKKIEDYRREQAIIRTFHRRPDLFKKAHLSDKEKQFIHEYAKRSCK